MPEYAAVVLAVLGGLVTIATAWKVALGPLYRRIAAVLHEAGEFLADWNGSPETPARPGRSATPARPGVLARLDHQRDSLETIRHQVLPNGGASIRDAVARIESHLADHIAVSQTDREDLRQRLLALQEERSFAVLDLRRERSAVHAAVDALTTETEEHHPHPHPSPPADDDGSRTAGEEDGSR